jgi:DNA-binding transcriptional MerR regulator
MGLKTSALAARTGTNPHMIRYYERAGLLPPAIRGGGGQRIYSEDDVARLSFVRRCRDFGISLEEVRRLTTPPQEGDMPVKQLRELANWRLKSVRAKLMELSELKDGLIAFIENCDAAAASQKNSADEH